MCECRLSWIASGQVHWWVFVTVVTKFEAHESRKYVNSYVATYQLCKKNSAPWSCVGLHACSNKICHFPKYQTLCVGDTQRSFHTFWTTPLDGCKWPLPHSDWPCDTKLSMRRRTEFIYSSQNFYVYNMFGITVERWVGHVLRCLIQFF